MKNSLLALSLMLLCACGGKRENASAEQAPPVTKVKIVSIVPPVFNYWDRDSKNLR